MNGKQMFSRAAAEGLTEEQKKRIVFGECYSALPPPCHAVLVLGGGVDEMQSRAASAAALCSRIPVGKVIASGGAVREFGGAPKAEPAARIRPADGNKDKTDTKNYAAARR